MKLASTCGWRQTSSACAYTRTLLHVSVGAADGDIVGLLGHLPRLVNGPVEIDFDFLDATLALEEINVRTVERNSEDMSLCTLWRWLDASLESGNDPGIAERALGARCVSKRGFERVKPGLAPHHVGQ